MTWLSILFSPEDISKEIANKAKSLRLEQKLSRKKLSQNSGVPESTIKRFEREGKVSLDALILIASALDSVEPFTSLFPAQDNKTLKDLRQKRRLRGRT